MAAGGVALAAFAPTNARVAQAQAQAAAPRVALVIAGTVQVQADRVGAFRSRLRELGYIEGRNLILEIHEVAGRFERLPALLDEIARSSPRIIVVHGSEMVKATRDVTLTIPVVAAMMGDPVSQGFAASLARPGGNVTGNVLFQEVSDQKTMEILREIVPGAKRVSVLSYSGCPTREQSAKLFQAAAAKLGLSVDILYVTSLKEVPDAFARAAAQRAQMLIVANQPLLSSQPKLIVDLAARHRIPAIYASDSFVADGGLAVYGFSATGMFRNAANFVDRILKGRPPGELPFEQPTQFEMVINLKTAKALGLTIPQSVLIRADRVIE